MTEERLKALLGKALDMIRSVCDYETMASFADVIENFGITEDEARELNLFDSASDGE